MDAGWYNDPFGRFAQRYHDGSTWTAHVSAGDGRSFTDPSGASAQIGGPLPTSPPTGAPVVDSGGRPADLASPWLRIAATILDTIILVTPLMILMFSSIDWSEVDLEAGETPFIPGWIYLVSLGIGAVYQIGMIGMWSRTLGQMATGLKVTKAGDRQPPGWGTATLRWVAELMYGIPFFGIGIILLLVSFVLMFADSKRQTLHDKIAGTLVVRS